MNENNIFSDPEVIKGFILEAKDHLESVEPNLLKLENNPDNQELLNDIFRSMHSIKGAASFLGFARIADLSHKLENILDKLRKKKTKANPEIIDLILEGKDILGELVDDISGGGSSDSEETDLPINNKIRQIEESFLRLGDSPQNRKTVEAYGEETGMKLGQIKITEPDRKAESDPEMEAFLAASRQYLDLMNDSIEQVKTGEITPTGWDTYIRAIRSLRNSSSYVKLERIVNLLDQEQELIEKLRTDEIKLSPPLVELLVQAYDAVKRETENPGAKTDETDIKPLLSSLSCAGKKEPESSRLGDILVTSGKIDPKDLKSALQSQKPLGEILVDQRKITREELKEALNNQVNLRAEKGVLAEHTIRVDESKLDHLMNLIGELIINRNRFSLLTRKSKHGEDVTYLQAQLKSATSSLTQISNDLQATIMKVRMLPINTVFQKFPRMVRDLSREKGKKIDLDIFGGKTEVDKTVIEKIGDPLIHLIRNSVDHGIEMPQEREKLEKPAQGIIAIRAFHEGHNVVVEVEDDGQGIDADLVKRKAVEKGMLTQEDAEMLDEAQALDLIFAPGFSTAKQVTGTSGRGVGMDVVKRNIQSLNGQILTTTKVGEGTKFSLRLPLTLAVIDVLMIESGEMIFALPLTAVQETLTVLAQDIKTINGKKVIVVRDQTLRIIELTRLLKIPSGKMESEEIPVVIIGENGTNLGLMVDAIREKEEIVIKPLENLLAQSRGFSGATILGNGDVVLILNPLDILRL